MQFLISFNFHAAILGVDACWPRCWLGRIWPTEPQRVFKTFRITEKFLPEALMEQEAEIQADLNRIKAEIKSISDTFVFSAREIMLHFQTLISAKAARMLMEAPGLYYPGMDFYVISRSGMNRGHESMYENFYRLFPPEKATCYGFVLYPESFVRTCLDKILRRTTKNITPQLRISMENVFNRKHHKNVEFVDSAIEKDLITRFKKDLGRI